MLRVLALACLVVASASEPAAPVVVASTYPLQQLTRLVVDGRAGATVGVLLPSVAGCPHDYAPTPQDLQRLAGATVVVTNGLGLDAFVERHLAATGATVVRLDTSAAMPEAERLAAAGHEGHAHAPPPNAHLFASPRQAARIVRWLGGEFARLDPADADGYRARARAAGDRLDALAAAWQQAVAALPRRALVAQHDVFAYLARDAGLTIAATIQDEPGHDPSAAAMAGIVARARAAGAALVVAEPQYPARVAETIARELGVAVVTLDPVASGPADAPATHYETVMATNLQTLQRALSGP